MALLGLFYNPTYRDYASVYNNRRGPTLYQNGHYTDCSFVVSCCALLAEFLDFGGFRTHPPNSDIFDKHDEIQW